MATSEEDVCTLIRLALACEASKRPLKREDIISLVLGANSRRSLRTLLAEANERLAADFAMQLVPLPAASRPLSTATVAGRKAASAVARQQRDAPAESSSYILISRERRSPRLTYHRHPKQLAYLTIILCMIALSGGEMEEEALREKFISLSPLPPPGGLSELINEWRRQRYLAVGRRVDDQSITVYSAGSRALLEFPPEYLAGFIADLFTKVSDVDGEERIILAARLKATLRVKSITSNVAGDNEGKADNVDVKKVEGNRGNHNNGNSNDNDEDRDGDEDEDENENDPDHDGESEDEEL